MSREWAKPRRCLRAFLVWVMLLACFSAAVAALGLFGDSVVAEFQALHLLSTGRDLYRAHNYTPSLIPLSEALDLAPRNFEARLLTAKALLHLQRYGQALHHAGRLLDVASADRRAQVLLVKAQALSGMGAWHAARETLNEIVQILPDSAEVYAGYASAEYGLHEYRRMAVAARRVAECPTDDASPEYAAWYAERKETAIRIEETLRENGHPSAETYYSLGIVYIDLGYWDKAMTFFAASVKSGDAPGDAWYWLGVGAEAVGEREDAITHYQSVLERCPNHLQALHDLIRLAGHDPIPHRQSEHSAMSPSSGGLGVE